MGNPSAGTPYIFLHFANYPTLPPSNSCFVSQKLQVFIQDTTLKQMNLLLFFQQACNSCLKQEEAAGTLSP
jgi:hypothetical protein